MINGGDKTQLLNVFCIHFTVVILLLNIVTLYTFYFMSILTVSNKCIKWTVRWHFQSWVTYQIGEVRRPRPAATGISRRRPPRSCSRTALFYRELQRSQLACCTWGENSNIKYSSIIVFPLQMSADKQFTGNVNKNTGQFTLQLITTNQRLRPKSQRVVWLQPVVACGRLYDVSGGLALCCQ